jgi:hypothetical protein
MSGTPLGCHNAANLRAQWARELDERFQLSFVGMDSALFNSVPTENPWDLHPRVIVSRDFLRQEHVLDAFREAELHWDLAVLDEAHGYTAYVDGKRYWFAGVCASRACARE